jgi:hypothetical protein
MEELIDVVGCAVGTRLGAAISTSDPYWYPARWVPLGSQCVTAITPSPAA